MKLSSLYIWKNVALLGYCALESYLSTFQMSDEQILCVDPTSDEETIRLAKTLEQKFQATRIVWFKWPEKTKDGSAIGIASNFALAQVTGTHVINIQADEVYPEPLLQWCSTDLRDLLSSGGECVKFKVLNTEHNAQRFQGGEEWDGRKDTDEWRRGGMFNGSVGGAAYNVSTKVAKVCASIRFAPDAWTFDGCTILHRSVFSETYPIIHLHDMMRDHYIDIRRNAADNLWNDKTGPYAHYGAFADKTEQTKDQWYSDPIWTKTESPFDSLLPDFVKPLIGQTTYRVRYELMDSF